MINLQNVTFSYAQTDGAGGIKNINLTVDSGEAVLLCGESGCGKTTLTRLINGLILITTRESLKEQWLSMG